MEAVPEMPPVMTEAAVNDATVAGTASSISTGNGLTTGQALSVNTGSSAFSTGAGSGFFYGGGSDSLTGATNFRSTGNFTGTLVALTADQTTAGTVLGISAQSLTSGKAIDVSLGTLYAGTTDAVAGYTIGAVNVRAQPSLCEGRRVCRSAVHQGDEAELPHARPKKMAAIRGSRPISAATD